MKLKAFLGLYCAGLLIDLTENLRTLWLMWNAGGRLAGAWEGLEKRLPEWRREAQRWVDEQGMRSDLAARLVQFYADWL